MLLRARYHDIVARRIKAIAQPVPFEHDGERLDAERGESLAAALIAADRLLLGRSPKLHRPRGPFCLRGGCEGCLVRVDGVPNVMACQRAVRGGEVVETQNVLGSRETDLLRATDFLFPHGIDHHRLFAGISGVSTVVQSFARRVAGLGRLPDAPTGSRAGRQRRVPVLVVGGGAAGLTAAAELGEEAWLYDDGLTPGGSLAALDPAAAQQLFERAEQAGAHLSSGSTVLGLYRPGPDRAALSALVLTATGAEQISAECVLLATGSHAGAPPFENNDLPGVWSARAALRLLRDGILVGDKIVIAGSGRFADALSAAVASLGTRSSRAPERVPLRSLQRASGQSRVRSVALADAKGTRKLSCDALVVDGPNAPGLELLRQAGGHVRFDPERGYMPDLDPDGRAAHHVYCAGSASGSEPPSTEGTRRLAAMLRERLG
jgi:sarcosine oxidase subunit alpha